jgi:hypothetical protein
VSVQLLGGGTLEEDVVYCEATIRPSVACFGVLTHFVEDVSLFLTRQVKRHQSKQNYLSYVIQRPLRGCQEVFGLGMS